MEKQMRARQAALKEREGEDILFSSEVTIYVLDCSGSMQQTLNSRSKRYSSIKKGIDEFASKMEVVKTVMEQIICYRGSTSDVDKVGVVCFPVYSGYQDSRVVVTPRICDPAMVSELSALYPQGDTPMLAGLEEAVRALSGHKGLCRIVLVTDGEATSSSGQCLGPSVNAEILGFVKALHEQCAVTVDVLGIGLSGVTSSYDEPFLRMVAEEGGGEFTSIGDSASFFKKLKHQADERKLLIGDGIRLLAAVAK